METMETKTVEAHLRTEELVLIGAAMEREGFRGTAQQYIAHCAIREARKHAAEKAARRNHELAAK